MKILVRMPNWLGDMVMATAFINELKKLEPNASIDIIVKSDLKELAEMIEGINEIYPFNKDEYSGIGGAIRFGKSIKRTTRYDLFFCLPNSFSSAAMGYAAGVKKRVGFAKELRTIWLNKAYTFPKTGHRVNRYLHLLECYYRIKITDAKVSLVTTPDESNKKVENKIIILNYNSDAPSRRMPLDKAISITNSLIANINADFYLTGSHKQIEFVTNIHKGLTDKTRAQNIAGLKTLKDLAEIMESADLVISTDSGPGHLANALGTPVISYFGAGDDSETAPYNSANLVVLKTNELDCLPCVKNTCKLYGTPKCLTQLDETGIVATAQQLLN